MDSFIVLLFMEALCSHMFSVLHSMKFEFEQTVYFLCGDRRLFLRIVLKNKLLLNISSKLVWAVHPTYSYN